MRPGYAYTEMCQQALKAALPQAQLCFPKVTCSLPKQANVLLVHHCPHCCHSVFLHWSTTKKRHVLLLRSDRAGHAPSFFSNVNYNSVPQ